MAPDRKWCVGRMEAMTELQAEVTLIPPARVTMGAGCDSDPSDLPSSDCAHGAPGTQGPGAGLVDRTGLAAEPRRTPSS